MVAQLDRTTGTFAYTRRQSDPGNGLAYTYESSTDLQSWSPIDSPAPLESGDGGSPVETVTVTVPAGLLAHPTLFVRVVAR
ncbi:MAG: hypothetical protein EOP83_26940 [Verrucomicrobiaceae bacterium]|nr:MAG: hypothetical protein EOP83_26940 [Verrucomicrobiaceae bacterium]